jgi:hypothetical protein
MHTVLHKVKSILQFQIFVESAYIVVYCTICTLVLLVLLHYEAVANVTLSHNITSKCHNVQ